MYGENGIYNNVIKKQKPDSDVLLQELLPKISEHIFSQFGSHIIRLALLLLSGRTITDQDLVAASSKKSQRWKSKQGPFKSIVEVHSKTDRKGKSKSKEPGLRITPSSFDTILKNMIKKLKIALKTTDTLKKAVMDPIAGPVVAVRFSLHILLVALSFINSRYCVLDSVRCRRFRRQMRLFFGLGSRRICDRYK